MLARTHSVFGILFGLICMRLLNFNSVSDYLAYFLLIQISVLLPDLDHPKARIHNNIIFSKIIAFIFKHRGFLHSIFPPIILAFFLQFYLGRFYALPVLIGYFSHLISDGLTKQGVKLFYPFFNFKLRGLLKTGSKTEKVLFYVIIFLIIIFYFFN